MKFLVYIIMFGFSLLAFTSCLSEDPKGQIPEDRAYSSADDIERGLVAELYNYIGGSTDSQGLQGTFRGVYDWNSLTTDEQILPRRGDDWYDGGFWQRLYNHTWTSSEEPLYDTWCYLYKVVMLCNRSLDLMAGKKSLLTDAQYMSYTSEVRSLRALYYFELMDMFGRVPIVTTTGISNDTTSQSSRSLTYWFVVNELQQSLPYLATGHSNYRGVCYGRITKPVAMFLLAKLALNAEVYTDDDWTDGKKQAGSGIFFSVGGKQLNAWQTTIAYCDSLAECGYRLEDDAANNFSIHNETSAENIFVIPMDKELYSNRFGYLFRSRHYAHGSALGLDAENGTSATLSTVRAFGYGTDSLDKRYAYTFYSDTVRVNGNVIRLDNGDTLVYRPLAVAPDVSGSEYEKTAGARMNKYEIDATAYEDGHLQDNDIVLFRYADALLMKAEAQVRLGTDGSAAFNAVRHRAGMPSRPATLDNILTERLLELMWEGWRRNDLIRFGRFHLQYDMRDYDYSYEGDAHTVVFPIPYKCLEMNHKLTQNPGY